MRLPETVQWTPGETGTWADCGSNLEICYIHWCCNKQPPGWHIWIHQKTMVSEDWMLIGLISFCWFLMEFIHFVFFSKTTRTRGCHWRSLSVSNEPHVFLGSWGWCRYTTCSSVPRSYCISVNIKKGECNVPYFERLDAHSGPSFALGPRIVLGQYFYYDYLYYDCSLIIHVIFADSIILISGSFIPWQCRWFAAACECQWFGGLRWSFVKTPRSNGDLSPIVFERCKDDMTFLDVLLKFRIDV